MEYVYLESALEPEPYSQWCGEMPENGHGELPDIRTAFAQGERLAKVETKIEGIEDATAVIRSHLHELKNEVQKIFVLEERCERSLVEIRDLTKDLPTIAASARSFADMRSEISAVIVERQKQEGAWKAIVGMGAALVGAFTVGGIGASIFWHFH